MIDKLLEWRIYTKLRSTYVEALPTLIATDGRLHTTFHQAVAVDRPAVVVGPEPPEHPDPDRARPQDPAGLRGRRTRPRPARRRLLADRAAHPRPRVGRRAPQGRVRPRGRHPSRDRGAVLHKARPTSIAQDERSMAKMVNFGMAYGMSDFGLSSRANIPREEAQEFINTYFATYSGISYYMMAIKEQARPRASSTRCSAGSARSPNCAPPTRRSAGPGSGWPSTCRSRAPPPTS